MMKPKLESNADSKRYVLSSQQKEIWVNQMLHPGVAMFNVGGHACIAGAIEIRKFEQALNHVIQMHEALRLRLHEGDSLPTQSVAEQLKITLEVCEFIGQEQKALEWMQHEHTQPFPLYDSFLFRFVLCKVSEDCYYWFTKYHYLIADGKTLSLIVQHVAQAYNALMTGTQLPSVQTGYTHYVESDQSYRLSARFAEDSQYWQQVFQNLPAPLLLPQHTFEFKEGEIIPSERLTLRLERMVFNQLEALVATHGWSMSNLFLGLLYSYFEKLNQQDDFVIGVTNLLHRGGEMMQSFAQTAGFFMNITPVRCAFGKQLSFTELLQALTEQQQQNARHGLLPIGEINRQAKVTRKNRNRSQLFELELAYIDFDCDVNFLGVPARFSFLSHSFEQYALTVYVEQFHAKGDVPVHFDYNLAFFNRAEMALLADRFEYLLQQVLEQPDLPIADLTLIPEAEVDKVLRQFNETRKPYSANRCIHQLFEAQVERSPDAIAIVFAEQSLTYSELNQRANQWAHYLQTMGVGPETLVGICVERSLEMIIGLLSILKAGGAYVPLDPGYPHNRLAFMLSDSQVPVLLTQVKWADDLPPHQAKVICLDRDWVNVQSYNRENPTTDILADHLAYVIYTSGSTGNPKGVMLEHGGLCNLVEDHIRCYHIQPHSRVLQFVSLSFDVATADIFMSLCAGATLCLPLPAIQALDAGLEQFLRELSVTHMQLPAPVLAALSVDRPFPDLEMVATGGEAPAASMVRQWSEGRHYFNVYGPTEATICATMSECYGDTRKPPIGSAIANTQIYILNEERQPVPIGVTGELYIGGKGLARGYLNQAELTAEKFVANPFSNDSSSRLYKSGDLARYLADGNLEFLGRVDHQVKIRGFRVELDEIEVALGQNSLINDNAVILHESTTQGKHLVAYLVMHSEMDCDDNTLREFLMARLPEYMVPATFVRLNAMPFTPNGKVDRQELAQRDTSFQPITDFIAPRTHEEQQLAACWAEILGLEQIGIYDNFFERGGDSLNGMLLVSQLQKKFDQSFQLATLFRYPTIAEFTAHMKSLPSSCTINAVKDQREMSLSFSQEEVWRHNQQSLGDTSYNIVNSFHLRGCLQLEILQQSFEQIMQRHNILRTRFFDREGDPIQIVDENVNVSMKLVDLSSHPEKHHRELVKNLLTKEENSAFDLEQTPLWRVTLLRLNDRSHVLILCFHHIIEDAWSLQVLLYELTALYTAYIEEQPSPLETLAIQYSDFANWQRQYFTSEILQKRYQYWLTLLKDKPAPLSLPADKPCATVEKRQVHESSSVSFELQPALTRQLRVLSQGHGSTLSVVLMAAYVSLLHQYSHQNDMVIGVPMSKRNQHQVEPLIGYFSGMSVLRIKLKNKSNFLEILERVQEAMQSAMENQDLTMKQIWNGLQLPWTGEQQLLFRTVFNFIPVPREAVHLPGLTLTPMPLNREKMVRDLVIGLWDKDGSGSALEGFFRYRQDLFEAETIAEMVEEFKLLLESVAERPGVPINELITKA